MYGREPYQDRDLRTRAAGPLSLRDTPGGSLLGRGEKTLSRWAPFRVRVNMVGGDMSSSSSRMFSACSRGAKDELIEH